ncbi:hypothetical protein HMPREF0497_0862 [Lentilactobacillus buchneri ATCC 11577]|nr:DUF5776 domain-containing protein [Lentilactobacillus hilgardii]EEI20372.1 hypothetical protein HMPREF0497_0862 [Lentilactobacillus buchneri ATCC 11577]MCT3395821.1 hypothetical protein [Lentilactobacillus hilgardii]
MIMETTHRPHANKLVRWLLLSLVAIATTITVSLGISNKAHAVPYDLNNMRWGLLPAGGPDKSGFPIFSNFDTAAISSTDWSPDPDGDQSFTSKDATLQKPYVIGTDTPKTVIGNYDKDGNPIGGDIKHQSDAKIGDTIQQQDGSTMTVTGFRIGANATEMGSVTGYGGWYDNLRAESEFFDFQVQEVDRNGQVVPNNKLTVFKKGNFQWSTILGVDKITDRKNNLVKVTITPINSSIFANPQTLYFSLTGVQAPVVEPKSKESNIGYALYGTGGKIGGFTSKDVATSTEKTPILLETPSDGNLYLEDLSNPGATWKADNPKLTLVKDPNQDQLGYRVSGLKSLAPGTIVKFTDTKVDGTTEDVYFKFGNPTTPGGGTTGGNTANGVNPTGSTTPPASITTTTSGSSVVNQQGTTTTGTSQGTPATSTSNTSIAVPKDVAVKGQVVYGLKKLGLYKNPTFTSSKRIAWYPKQKRINRPMFVVTGYARSANGTLRYKVRDVNHGTKTAGKTGYITTSKKVVLPVYYASLPKNNKITVISKKGVNAYKAKNLTGKLKHYKTGTHLTVKKLVKHNLTTRYQLSNGLYVTANKKLVIVENN